MRLDEHMAILANCHAYVTSTDDADDDIAIVFVGNGTQQRIDLSVIDAMRFRDLLNAGITNAFEVCEELRCPACGYTWEDARMHGDHRTCRQFPFFPSESGKSHAITIG